MISRSRRDTVGGGGSSMIFPGSPKADAIRWGGGVVAAISVIATCAKSTLYPTVSDIRE